MKWEEAVSISPEGVAFYIDAGGILFFRSNQSGTFAFLGGQTYQIPNEFDDSLRWEPFFADSLSLPRCPTDARRSEG
jgi:hypothetical protein